MSNSNSVFPQTDLQDAYSFLTFSEYITPSAHSVLFTLCNSYLIKLILNALL